MIHLTLLDSLRFLAGSFVCFVIGVWLLEHYTDWRL